MYVVAAIIREYAATFGAERTHVYRSVLLKPDKRGQAMYGDVIQFYNDIYVPQLKTFLMALVSTRAFCHCVCVFKFDRLRAVAGGGT